jgi:hypothetical protein
MRASLRFISVIVMLVMASTCYADALSKWSDKSGKFAIEATLVKIENNNVVLRKKDGKEITVPLDKLDSKSRQQAESQFSAKKPPTTSSSSGGGWSGLTIEEYLAKGQQLQDANDIAGMVESLPPSHQADVSNLVKNFAEHVDEELFNEATGTAQRVVKLLRSKKQFIFGSEAMSKFNTPENQKVFDAGVDLVAAATSQKSLNLNALLSGDLKRIASQFTTAIKPELTKLEAAMKEADLGDALPVPNLDSLKKAEFKIVSSTATTATVQYTFDEMETTTEFVQVDGYWMPKQLSEGWDETMSKANDGVNALTPQNQKMALASLKGMVNQFFAPLEAANTQEAFDAAIGPMMMMAMMGGGLGGGFGGAGDEGGFGPPGFGPGGPGFGPGGPGFGPGFGPGDFK